MEQCFVFHWPLRFTWIEDLGETFSDFSNTTTAKRCICLKLNKAPHFGILTLKSQNIHGNVLTQNVSSPGIMIAAGFQEEIKISSNVYI